MYNKYKDQIITVPFEKLVFKPDEFIQKICSMLNTKKSKKTNQILKKNKVPRKKLSESIPLDIYKRCGWEPPDKNLTEEGELLKRKQFVIDQKPNSKYLDQFEKICFNYEKDNRISFNRFDNENLY